jgi:ABC-type antimicrobial peptide transport system permease subunit
MGITLLRGRGFTEEDVQQKAKVCVVDENMVKQHFVGQDPLNHSIDGSRIIGVVSTLKDPETMFPDLVKLYVPVTNYCSHFSDLVIRTDGDPLALTGVLKAQVAELDPDLAITDMYALKDHLANMLAPRRYVTLLLGLFALIALLLAAIGIYGLLRHMVEQRFNEIGIRMALGATTGNVTRVFLRKGVILLLLGTSLGLIGGYAAKKILASFLYQAQFTNLVLLSVSITVLLATGLLACYIPARRAAKIDPMTALRYE